MCVLWKFFSMVDFGLFVGLVEDREIVANSLAAKIVEELVLRMAVWT